MEKCYYQSQKGNALCNLDICPKEKTLFYPGGDPDAIHGIIKSGDLSQEDIEDLKRQFTEFMTYIKESNNEDDSDKHGYADEKQQPLQTR